VETSNVERRTLNIESGEWRESAIRHSIFLQSYELISIAEQFLQLIAGGVFTGTFIVLADKVSPRKFKILAKISDGLLSFRFRAAIAALMGRARIVT
jgi:hypothetical protein